MNTYGVPNYKEVNPSFFVIVTFPFLFGIMYGDVGHGVCMLLMASCLCLFNSYLEKKVPSLAPMLSARYMLLMMGFFAVYCGLMYNDMMAIPIWSAWGSCYEIPEKTTPGQELKP